MAEVFKGKNDVVKAFNNWFLMIYDVSDVSDVSYFIKNDSAAMISKVNLNNTGGDPYSIWEYDYFKFNEKNQIILYRPIFDTGSATHELLGFDIASRCKDARKLADKN